MATKLGKMVTYIDGSLPIKLHDHLIKLSSKIMWQPNFEGILPTKLHDALITWSFQITWSTKGHYISTITMPVVTKHGRIVFFGGEGGEGRGPEAPLFSKKIYTIFYAWAI